MPIENEFRLGLTTGREENVPRPYAGRRELSRPRPEAEILSLARTMIPLP